MNDQRVLGLRAVPLAVTLALLGGCGDSDLPAHHREVLAEAGRDEGPATATVQPSSGAGDGDGASLESAPPAARPEGSDGSGEAPSTSAPDAGSDTGDGGPEPETGAARPVQGTDGSTGEGDDTDSPETVPIASSGQDGGDAGDGSTGDAGTDGDAAPAEGQGGAAQGDAGAAEGDGGAVAAPADLDPDGSKAAGSSVEGIDLADYDLVFEDEFDGTTLDASRWKTAYEHGNFPIDGEEQYYVDAMAEPEFGYDPFTVSGGRLTISAAETPDALRAEADGRNWLSGVISTAETFTFVRGYAEMQVDLPEGAGLGSMFTLIASAFTDTGLNPIVYVARHDGDAPGELEQDYEFTEDGERKTVRAFTVEESTLPVGLHTVGLSWSESELIYYVDGKATYTVIDDEVRGNLPAEPMYLVANLAVGGVRRSSPDADTPRPAAMVIDRVRVWQPR